MTYKALVPVADGVEEMETVTIVDVFRRAGVEVTMASVHDYLQITASRGVKLVADRKLEDCRLEKYDLIALPGGIPGAENFKKSETLIEMLREQKQANKWHAAICASPALVFEPHSLLENTEATCHPSFAPQLSNRNKADNRVVADGYCVTSQGPGTALEFALKLLELLCGRDKMEEVAAPMLAILPK